MRKGIVIGLVFAAMLGLELSCSKPDKESPTQNQGESSIRILLTDAPIQYTAVNVYISGIDYHSSADPLVIDGWDSLPLMKRGAINLLSLQNGDTTALTNTTPLTLEIRQLRMRLAPTGHTITVNGTTHPLFVTAELVSKGVIMPFKYSLIPNQTITLWIDFDVAKSISFDTASMTYTLRPVLRTFDPFRSARIIGNISPAEANAIVYIDKTDSSYQTICFPDIQRAGYFAAMGLDSGAYNVRIVPSNTKYRARTLFVPRLYADNHTFSLGAIQLVPLPYLASARFEGNWRVYESVRTIFPDAFVGEDSFYAPIVAVNDSSFATIQTGRMPDPAWVSSWPFANADTLYFTALTEGNVLRNSYQGNIGYHASNCDTLQFQYVFGVGNLAYRVNQKWVRKL